jgi:hypothetical protein
MKPTITTSTTDATAKFKASLAKLTQKQVYVGVPEDRTSRQMGAGPNNAQLVYLHTHGSPLQGLPARPIIEPAIEAADNKANIAKQLALAARAALENKPTETTAHLNQAGTLGRSAAISWFVDPRNGWAPNSPATIAEKGSDKPLIDTAQMRRSITFLVADE